MVPYSPYAVVTVPFPFTDQRHSKRRPALVLSSVQFGEEAGHSVLAMITSAKNSTWFLDTPIADQAVAGLPAPSVVRMKLFTLDNRLIVQEIGQLSATDQRKVQKALSQLLPQPLTTPARRKQ